MGRNKRNYTRVKRLLAKTLAGEIPGAEIVSTDEVNPIVKLTLGELTDSPESHRTVLTIDEIKHTQEGIEIRCSYDDQWGQAEPDRTQAIFEFTAGTELSMDQLAVSCQGYEIDGNLEDDFPRMIGGERNSRYFEEMPGIDKAREGLRARIDRMDTVVNEFLK